MRAKGLPPCSALAHAQTAVCIISLGMCSMCVCGIAQWVVSHVRLRIARGCRGPTQLQNSLMSLANCMRAGPY